MWHMKISLSFDLADLVLVRLILKFIHQRRSHDFVVQIGFLLFGVNNEGQLILEP